MNKFRYSIKYKFILFTTFAIIIFMSIIGYIAVIRERNTLLFEIERQGKLLGATLAAPVINDLVYEKLGLVEEGGLLDNYLMELYNRKEANLIYIAILDEQGKVISHNNISEYGKKYTDPLTVATAKSDQVMIKRIRSGEHEALDFGIPLTIGKKRWGSLRYAISLEKVEQEISSTLKRIIALTVGFLIIGFGIILLLTKRFIGPITELVNTMEKARGDFLDIKVKVQGNDEIAILGQRFNSMIERIKLTNEKLVQSEKLASIGILAAGVAHEINNPLGGIFNCLEMLKKDGANPESRKKYLELVEEGLERIENTVNKLLWISRKGSHTPQDLNIRDNVESVYALLEYKIKKAKILFQNEIDNHLHFRFDMHDLQQLFLNLFINAIHAMPEGGVLTVKGYRANNHVCLEVIDTGSGIPPEDRSKIFDPFFTTKPPGEGTGLGLWLTYEIVRTYGGEINVLSEIGQGSNFILRFPEIKNS